MTGREEGAAATLAPNRAMLDDRDVANVVTILANYDVIDVAFDGLHELPYAAMY